MQLSPSAHVDTFCRDNLPPQSQWPEFRFDLPDVQYPDRLNCAVELLDTVIAADLSNLDALVSGTPDEVEEALVGRGVPATAFTAPILVDFDGGGFLAPFAP